MKRKRITEMFPFLLPIRKKQRKIIFYAKMYFDGNIYAKTKSSELLHFCIYETKSKLLNENTGFDMIYQENKIFNLKLAAKALNGLLIKPSETFSFWQAVRYADKHIPYRDGLTVINGKLVTSPGGGLCQMSNLLFWVFLHSPLTILERHTHKVKEFPTLRNDEPEGVDATVSEGWLDLKVKNETDVTFQLCIGFDEENILGSLYADREMACMYKVESKDLCYFRKDGKIFEKIRIYRSELAPDTHEILSEYLLYENLCEIGYQLPKDTTIVEKGD